jgi:hypothetical protein
MYSIWLVGGFFMSEIPAFVSGLTEGYLAAEFFFPDVFSKPAFVFLSLFIGGVYFFAGINILTMKYNNRIGATYVLFSVWIFIMFIVLLKIKEGLAVGFSAPDFQSGIDDVFLIVRVSIPSCLLPLLTGDDLQR